jgi:hypothetical protein
MTASEESETELDAYREQVERPLGLFRTYTPGHASGPQSGTTAAVQSHGMSSALGWTRRS